MHTATFTLAAASAEAASNVAAALTVEADDAPPGTVVTTTGEDASLVIAIEAQDLGGLRAAIQSALRLSDAALRVHEGRP